jgi:hypothetical protein
MITPSEIINSLLNIVFTGMKKSCKQPTTIEKVKSNNFSVITETPPNRLISGRMVRYIPISKSQQTRPTYPLSGIYKNND